MTLTTLAPAAPARTRLLDDLAAAATASAAAHDATRALTDTVLAAQPLPAEIYQYAPYLTPALAALTAAARTLSTVTGQATADPGPDRVHALRQATAGLSAATADLRGQLAALATAVAWYGQPTALPTAAYPTPELQL